MIKEQEQVIKTTTTTVTFDPTVYNHRARRQSEEGKPRFRQSSVPYRKSLLKSTNQ